GPGTEMADDLAGAQAAQFAASSEIPAMGQAEEEPGGVKIAGPGGVHDARDWRRCHVQHLLLGDDVGAALAARQHRDLAMAADMLGRLLEMLGLVERADLVLVGEQHVDMALDQVEELGAVAPDAEGI